MKDLIRLHHRSNKMQSTPEFRTPRQAASVPPQMFAEFEGRPAAIALGLHDKLRMMESHGKTL